MPEDFAIVLDFDRDMALSMIPVLQVSVDDGLLNESEAYQVLCDYCITY